MSAIKSQIEMLKSLFNIFGKREHHGKYWSPFGSIEYGTIKGDIPKWVLDEERRISRKYGGTSSSLLDKHFFLKGRHFEYRLTYAGQGGSIVYIHRRKR